jgi:hypothetical protein
MDGFSAGLGWELVLIFLIAFSVVLMGLSVVLVGLGGAIYWAVRRSVPSNPFVKTCMILGAVLLTTALVLWIADGAKLPAHITGIEQVFSGRT